MASPGPLQPVPRSAAVSKGYSFGSTWEQNAPLTEQQLAAVVALGQICAERSMPAHLAGDNSANQATQDEASALSDVSQQRLNLSDLALANSHQFYKWHTDLEVAMKSETEEKYRQYVNTLTGHLNTCDELLGCVDSTLGLFDDLQAQHQAVALKTKTLHDACERLVMEKDRLVEFADALKSKLNYFDELESIATQFHAPTMSVASGHFLPLLKRLDECISYVTNNPQYADSSTYLVKFRQLQSRALGMVRTHVLSVLRSAAAQVQSAIRESVGLSGKSSIAEGSETSVLYVRFKAAAHDLKPLMEEIESRASRKEYSQVLSDCHKLYCEQRLSLVQGVVMQRLAEYARNEPLTSLTRSGGAYLIQVCQLEHQLFDHFFPSSSSEVANLTPLVDPLCTALYDTLRPKFIHEADLDQLCELVEILKGEMLDEQLSRRGESVAGLRPIILRTLADVQERLTFRAQTYMRDEIANYLPLAEDLDYPSKLEQAAAAAAASGHEDEESRDAYAAWYTPVERTLSCLSKLYRCLEPGIFTGLAQDGVNMCSSSIQRASKLIAKKSSFMDAQLFLIKHLLILREQISPFDIEFSVTYKELDFTHLLEHLRKILRGQASMFDLTSRSALARVFSPRVLENQVDAKHELEKNLKATCEQFIMYVTKIAVEPMLSFITKVTAIRVATSNIAKGGPGEVRVLKQQAFATPEKLAELVVKVDEALKEQLPAVMAKMKLYLPTSPTRAILFKPIKTNIIEAHGQILSLIQSEYSEEDAKTIGLRSLPDLQAYLDELC